jgi:hypothetical protein
MINKSLSHFRFVPKALRLVWDTSKILTIVLIAVTIINGLLPALIAYIGKLIVDSVLLASQETGNYLNKDAYFYVGMEALVIIILAGSQKASQVSQALLRVLLGQKVNVLILEKALTLELSHFEDSEFYDKMTQSRTQASSRPLSLVSRIFNLLGCSSSIDRNPSCFFC